MWKRGTVVRVRDDKGFGFIRVADGGQDAFFHASSLEGIHFGPHLQEMRIEFIPEVDPSGRVRATRVRAAA